MPRNKKRQGRSSRGKKSKLEEVDTQPDQNDGYYEDHHEQQQYDESAIQRPPGYQPNQAFFGYVEPDVQQYFKNVEATLDDPKFETAEEQQLFVNNVYSEVENREFILATDHGCSLVLEKLLSISSDFELRVFFDKFNGRFNELFTHRFASHVCQTLLTLAADVVERESKGESIPGPDEVREEESAETQEDLGELLSMEKLFLSMCEQLQPSLASLISDSYASHIIRVIMYVLAGRRFDDEENNTAGRSTMRSKKSTKYNEQHNNSAVKAYTKAKTKTRLIPSSFTTMLRTMTTELTSSLNETIVRTLAVHQVASPVLQLLLELQTNTEDGEAIRNLLIDRILWGIASEDTVDAKAPERDAWIETLLRDTVGSHLLERILRCSSARIFNALYTSYFRGRILKLCAHPIANFVVQALFVNAWNEVQLAMMVEEAAGGFGTFLTQGKPGVIRSIIDACVKLNACHKEVVNGLCAAVHCHAPTERKEFVNCVLRMWTYETWVNTPPEERASPKTHHTQGALTLQSLLTLPEEHNAIVVNSFLAQVDDVTFPWTREPIASRVIEAILTSPNVNLKAKRKLLRNYIGHYHELALDKYGGHIVDKCWTVADLDMKEKIAAELLDHEPSLSQSFYGRFILRNCKIDNFKRKREEWMEHERGAQRKKEMFKDFLEGAVVVKGSKTKDLDAITLPANSNTTSLGFEKGELAELAETDRKKKKKGRVSVAAHAEKMLIDSKSASTGNGKHDEIDALFKKSKNKRKRGQQEETATDENELDDGGEVVEAEESIPANKGKKKKKDKDLANVLDAIDATKKKRAKNKAGGEGGETGNKANKEEKTKRKFEA